MSVIAKMHIQKVTQYGTGHQCDYWIAFYPAADFTRDKAIAAAHG